MNDDDRIVPFDEFLGMCHSAKDHFAFLESMGFMLTKEAWPSGDSFRDGFSLAYSGADVSVVVEYYDMELVIHFLKQRERIPYLFIDHELMNNASGFGGCMFSRGQLSRAMKKMAADIKDHYQEVLLGNHDLWKRIIAMWHAPREKKKLP
jgi:hypothetical protein